MRRPLLRCLFVCTAQRSQGCGGRCGRAPGCNLRWLRLQPSVVRAPRLQPQAPGCNSVHPGRSCGSRHHDRAAERSQWLLARAVPVVVGAARGQLSLHLGPGGYRVAGCARTVAGTGCLGCPEPTGGRVRSSGSSLTVQAPRTSRRPSRQCGRRRSQALGRPCGLRPCCRRARSGPPTRGPA